MVQEIGARQFYFLNLVGLWVLIILGLQKDQKSQKFSKQVVRQIDCCYLRAGFCPSTRVTDNIQIFRVVLMMSQKILQRQIYLKPYFKYPEESDIYLLFGLCRSDKRLHLSLENCVIVVFLILEHAT